MTTAAPELQRAGFVRLACLVCGWRFFTTGGRDRHLTRCRREAAEREQRAAREQELARGREALRTTGLRVTALNNNRRFQCGDCDKTSTPSGIALHQRYTGHVGRTEIEAKEAMS